MVEENKSLNELLLLKNKRICELYDKTNYLKKCIASNKEESMKESCAVNEAVKKSMQLSLAKASEMASQRDHYKVSLGKLQNDFDLVNTTLAEQKATALLEITELKSSLYHAEKQCEESMALVAEFRNQTDSCHVSHSQELASLRQQVGDLQATCQLQKEVIDELNAPSLYSNDCQLMSLEDLESHECERNALIIHKTSLAAQVVQLQKQCKGAAEMKAELEVLLLTQKSDAECAMVEYKETTAMQLNAILKQRKGLQEKQTEAQCQLKEVRSEAVEKDRQLESMSVEVKKLEGVIEDLHNERVERNLRMALLHEDVATMQLSAAR